MKTFYRGSTFQQAGQIQKDGVPQDCTGWTLAIQIYDKPGTTLISSLTITWIDQTQGLFQAVNAGDSSAWPLGPASIWAQTVDTFGTIIKSAPDYFRIAESPIST